MACEVLQVSLKGLAAEDEGPGLDSEAEVKQIVFVVAMESVLGSESEPGQNEQNSKACLLARYTLTPRIPANSTKRVA